MSRRDIIDLLERYSRNETTPEEILQVEKWLDSQTIREKPWGNIDQQQWLSSLKMQIDASIAKPVQTPVRRMRRLAIASVAAIILISLGIWWLRFPGNNQELTAATTNAGQRSIILADGSTVWLNKGSKLQYPEKFDGNTREVYLEGEAYFDIRHDEQKTFIVHTGQIHTTVVGTAFNIMARSPDSSITVTVTRGKVKVNDGAKLLAFIIPNQQLSYNIQKHNFRKTEVDAAAAISWKAGDLLFDDVTFGEAAEMLSKRFNVKISFTKDEIKNCRFTGTALSGKNLDEILKVICAFNKATYKYNNDGDIMIDGDGCR